MDNNQNPESLHNVGQGKESKTNPAFVNPGTPAAPLTTMADKPDPEVSKSATSQLRNHITGGEQVK